MPAFRLVYVDDAGAVPEHASIRLIPPGGGVAWSCGDFEGRALFAEEAEAATRPGCIALPSIPAGTWRVEEDAAPRFEYATEGPDGSDVVGSVPCAPLPRGGFSFEVSDAEGIQDVVCRRRRCAPGARAALAGGVRRARRLRALMRRDKELDGEEARTVSLAGAVLIAASLLAYALLAAPALLVLASSLAALPMPGYGLQYLSGNISGYLGGYLFDGWSAVGALAGAHPDAALPAPAAALLLLAGAAASAAPAWMWVKARFDPRNPILDALPPEAGHGEKGTAKLVADQREVRRRVGSCAAGEVPEDPGAYCGYLFPPASIRLASNLAWCAGDAWERLSGGSAPEALRPEAAGRLAYLPGEGHTVIFGDTGAGKTRRLLLSTIDLLSRCEGESMVIFDPKGELYGLSSGALEARGCQTVVIDFRNPAHSSGWNILGLARDRWEDGDVSGAIQEVNEVVANIAPRLPNEGAAKFFNDGARSLISSASLEVVCSEDCPDDQRNMATVSRLIEAYVPHRPINPGNPADKRSFSPYEELLAMHGDLNHPAFEAFSGARSADAKELRQFVSTAQTFLSLFRDPSLASLMSKTDNPFRNIALKRQAVFLIIPDNKLAYAPFATLCLNQIYTALTDLGAKGIGGRSTLPQRVNFICEELCSIPKWEALNSAINIARGRNIRFFLIVQNKALFDSKYEDDAEAIISNCANKIFIKTGDLENTAKWISKSIGEYTIEVASRSYSGPRFAPFMLQKSVNYSLEARARLTDDEVLRWKADYGSIVLTGDEPFVVRLPDVSMTPTQAAFGMGSQEHNLGKIYRALNPEGAKPRADPGTPWSPEFAGTDWRGMTDAQRLARREAFMAELARSAARRLERQAGAKGPRRAEFGALYDPATGKRRAARIVDARFFDEAISLTRKGYSYKVGDKKEVEAWLKEMESRRAKRAEGAEPPAKPEPRARKPAKAGGYEQLGFDEGALGGID